MFWASVVGTGFAVALTVLAIVASSTVFEQAFKLPVSPGVFAAELMLVNPSEPMVAGHFLIVSIAGNSIFYMILCLIIIIVHEHWTIRRPRDPR